MTDVKGECNIVSLLNCMLTGLNNFFCCFKFLLHIRTAMNKQINNMHWWWHTISCSGTVVA